MVKFRLYFDQDKETMWLNEMAQRGYAMIGFFWGFYLFALCLPGEYVYQIDVSQGLFRVSNDYREFMRETGVEIVCLWGIWVFLRKKATEGPFVLYTDVESSIEYYSKIRMRFKVFMILEFICFVMELLAALARNNMTALAFSCLLVAIIVVFMRQLTRIDNILDDLKERVGLGTQRGRKKRISLLTSTGMLINCIGFAVPIWAANASFGYGLLKGFCHGLAIVLITAGIVRTLLWRGE